MKKIGIIGLGVLGGAVKYWFLKNKYKVLGYDKFKKIGDLSKISEAEIIFLCLPTPYDSKLGYKLSALEENIKFFKEPKIFVIKSTVLPGTTDYFQKKFSQHKFLHNPEFLREKFLIKDFIKPDLQIVGYTEKSRKIAVKILKILPQAPWSKIVKAKVSELAKISINNFLALKVYFANQIYDLAEKLKINYLDLEKILESEPRLGRSHFKIWHNGYRGFGGKCLPKELKSVIILFKRLKIEPKLFELIDKENFKLIKKQGLADKFFKNWLNNKS